MAGGIDRIHGPHDGVVELVIVLQQDWDSDPFLVKDLRGKVASYQEYLMGGQFRASFAGCRGVIVLETRFFPPEEVQNILAKEGVEIRVSTEMPAAAAQPPQAMAPQPPQAMAAQPPQAMAPQGMAAQPPQAMAPQGMAAQPPQAMAPQPMVYEGGTALPQPLPLEERESWEIEEEDDFLVGSGGGGSLPMSFFIALGFLILSSGVMLYALMGWMSPVAETSPRGVIPKTISAKTLPKELHATISVHVDRRAFVIIPIQDRAGKEQVKYHLLFGVKETPRLLVFTTFAQSNLPVRVVNKSDPNDPENKLTKVVMGKMSNFPAQTYTGRLERLQRYENGPLELVLPGGNRDVNKIIGLSKKFPMDSMILVVGAKPHAPSRPYFVIFLAALLGILLSGSILMSLRNRAQRSF